MIRNTLSCAVIAILLSSAAFAQAPAPVTSAAPAAPMAGAQKMPKDGPCYKIKQACEQAGFVKGGAKDGKGLKMNCIKPLMQGQAVAGVTVSADQISACKAKKAKMKPPQGQMPQGLMQPAPQAAPAAPAAQ